MVARCALAGHVAFYDPITQQRPSGKLRCQVRVGRIGITHSSDKSHGKAMPERLSITGTGVIRSRQDSGCQKRGSFNGIATTQIGGGWRRRCCRTRKKEAICLQLGKESRLGHSYRDWGLLARAQGDKETEKQKFEQARALLNELKMSRERDEVQVELEKLGG